MALAPTEHPHVWRNAKSRPVIGESGIEVHILAEYWRLGWSPAQLAEAYPYLEMSEILDALSFYLDHRDEVDSLIQANRVGDERAETAP